MASAPLPPLIADGEGVQRFPERPSALIARMAAVYSVGEDCVLPTQGFAQALGLIMRTVALDGRAEFAAPARADIVQLARVNRIDLVKAPGPRTGAVLQFQMQEPDTLLAEARRIASTLLVVDESFIEFEDTASAAALTASVDNLIVIRDLAYAYGLAGAPCAALIAAPALIARLRGAEEPGALATPIVKLALSVLEPQRMPANAARIAELRAARSRLASELPNARAAAGPFVWIAPADKDDAVRRVRQFGLAGEWRGDRFLLALGDDEANYRALAAFGSVPQKPHRRAEIVRDTQETRIVARVDLDNEGAGALDTGVGFFDHMLAQISAHGGFSLSLTCAGDLEVDAHHTIEDCALALGQALKQALGARRGIARFGFTLPMDEAQARVSVDLGGRPYVVFSGAFAASHIGAYPTEMTEHVFRSLAQSMGAAIHVEVSGENDHHKTEACFKAFGRALRQAVRIEGDVLPSTKGVI